MTETSAAPFPVHTAPSGKVTKWGMPGTDETFKTKGAALAWLASEPSAPDPEAALAHQEAEEMAAEREAGRDDAALRLAAETAPTIADADLIPEGAETKTSKGGYRRVLVNAKPVGYINDRKRGAKLVEVPTARLAGADKALTRGTTVRGNYTGLLVTDEAGAAQARALLAYAPAA